MIELAEGLWVGGSEDEKGADFDGHDICAVLNVAHDLQGTCGWSDGIEYAQVGLIDGPGNEIGDYCAALLCLKALLRRHDGVLVYDHNGCRAFVVAMMYLNLTGGHIRPNPTAWSHWPTWEEQYEMVTARVEDVPNVDEAHIVAFNKMPWGLITVL